MDVARELVGTDAYGVEDAADADAYTEPFMATSAAMVERSAETAAAA